MPKVSQTFELEVSPQRYLDACSPMELVELDLLILSERYQSKIRGFQNTDHSIIKDIPELNTAKMNGLQTRQYYCTFCKINPVDADNGFDTCSECLAKQ